jgi:hypothetical protein
MLHVEKYGVVGNLADALDRNEEIFSEPLGAGFYLKVGG